MLIDIKSFIQQLLLPNWRTPDYIGLAQVLFQPIQYVLKGQEAYEQTLLFRAGLTGQKLILEHYLQTTVDGGIYLQDEDGVRLDFAVIVPQTLSTEKRKEVRDIVQTYKLAGRRFEMRDAFALSSVGGVLQWTAGYPQKNSNKIALSVSVSGSYQTRILRRGQSAYLVNENINFIANQAYVTPDAPEGIYSIEVGSLLAELDLTATAQRVCDLRFDDDRPAGVECVNVGGVRKVIAYLYSAYANLDPFEFSLFYYNSVTGQVGALAYSQANILNPQPLTVTLPDSLPADNYSVRFRDKDGCVTPPRIITVPVLGAPPTCTIAWDDTAGANTAISISTVGQQYQIVAKVLLGQTASKTLKVTKIDDTLILSSGFAGATTTVLLPVGTTQQDIKIEVTEGSSCTTGTRSASLPALPAAGATSMLMTGGIDVQQNPDGTWSIVNTPMSVMMSRARSYAYDNSGVGAFSQGTESSSWIGYIFINDVPLKNGNSRKDFTNISLPAGQLISVRVIWLEQDFYNGWDVVKSYLWRVREPRITAQLQSGNWVNVGEPHAQYHPWKFWKQAQALIKT